MRHGSLFSGIGGFDLAAEWMGWENVFHCEWMEFPRKVLDYYWPYSDSHIDICKTDFKKYANKIDILTGGFPCQPFSTAGKRKGKDDERYLWGEMLRAIQEIKPKYVIAENVFGITNIDGGMVFQQVCLDLENEGYEVQPFIIPASAKNAPHRRDRVWFIAFKNTLHSGCLYRQFEKERTKIRKQRNTCTRSTDGIYLSKGNVTNSNCNGFNKCNRYNEKQSSEGRIQAQCDIEQSNVNEYVTNANSSRTQTRKIKSILGKSNSEKQARGFINDDVQRITTDTSSIGQESRNINNTSNISKTHRFEQFYEPTDWTKFPTQSPICGGDDGLPTKLDGITFPKWRAESIKGYGNAIVPQIAYELFKIIDSIHETQTNR